MTIKQRFQRRVTMTVLQMASMLIVTLLSTAGLLATWPRFRNDAMSLDWYVYLILVGIFVLPLVKRNKAKGI